MTDTRHFALKYARNDNTSGKGSQFNTKIPSRVTSEVALVLPPLGATRWGARSKAAVVTAVRSGALSLDEACKRYALSTDEYLSWETALDTLGLEGLGLAGRQRRRRALTYCDK